MRTPAILALALAGCGGASPCQPAVAGGEPYCAILCANGAARAERACPRELPERTDLPGAAVCRAVPGALSDAICAQVPGQCGAPPPVPDERWRAVLAERTTPVVRECDAGVALRWPGPLGATPDEARAERARAIPGVDSIGVSECCVGDPELCMRVVYRRHATDPARLVDALEAALAPDAEHGLAVRLESTGLLGPRCTPDNDLCLPDPYEGCVGFDPEGARRPSDLGTSRGACAHDGECIVGGCGNDCVAWTLTGPGTCEDYTRDEPTFCGCVESRCQWFTQ